MLFVHCFANMFVQVPFNAKIHTNQYFIFYSQLSSLHKAHSLRRKKRRNMLAIFGFRKNRNQSASNQEPEAESEVYGDGGHLVAPPPPPPPPTGFVFTRMSHDTSAGVVEFAPSSVKTGTDVALKAPC